jgi:phosphohistidine phosphatase
MSENHAATLYFLRHGEAADAGTWRGDDFSRPLTDRGRERLALEAQALKQLGLAVEEIVTSPLLRARQTAAIVADALRMADRLVADERLGADFSFAQLARLLHDHPTVRSLMLVGHEPSFSSVIGRLIGGASVEVKKGSLARVDLSGTSGLKGELIWLVPPRVLLLGLPLVHSQSPSVTTDRS